MPLLPGPVDCKIKILVGIAPLLTPCSYRCHYLIHFLRCVACTVNSGIWARGYSLSPVNYPPPLPSTHTHHRRKMTFFFFWKLDILAPHLPTNTLDELVEGLGGPDKVAEMTGRRGRVVSLPNGSVQYQLRSEVDVSMEALNITKKQRFMDGEKVSFVHVLNNT